jgi:pimeloyl-ACP methyl ester carboxylesterase
LLQESVRQGATGWVDDNLRLARPWPFRLQDVEIEVRFHHGEADLLAPPHQFAERIPGSRLRLYPGEGHLSIGNHIKEIVEALLAA